MANKRTGRMLEAYKNKRILITGAGGYIGYNLSAALNKVQCEIVRLFKPGSTAASKIASGAAKIRDISGDINDGYFWEGIIGEGIDFVFHFAAQTSVYVADKDPAADMKINVLPIISLLEACRHKTRPVTIIFAGTSTEVGMPKVLPVSEMLPDNPLTIYDIHKLTAEKYLLSYARNGIVFGVSLRLTNVYGPGPKSGSADRGVLNLMIRKALGGEELTVYGDGGYIRDYVFVEDVVNAFLTAGTNIRPLNGNYYLIGSGTGNRIIDAVELIAARVKAKAGIAAKVVHVSSPKGLSVIESRDFVADITQFKKAAGWSPKTALAEGIDRTIDYYRDN